MKTVANTLTAFCEGSGSAADTVDRDILVTLGEKTPVKHWLAACLAKTIRSQLAL